MGVSLKCKLKSTRLLIDLREDKYLVYATVSLNADDDCRAEMARLINRINWSMVFGNFEMDERDGEIRFRLPVNCDCEGMPSREVVRDSIVIPALMMQKYGDAIVKVLMGVCDWKTAYDAVEQK